LTDSARELDAAVAASIAAADKTCILRNRHNSELDRITRSVTCRTHNARRRTIHNDLDDDIEGVRKEIAATSSMNKELKAQLKDLTEQKKELGRTPRHNQSGSSYDIEIPVIHHRNTFPTIQMPNSNVSESQVANMLGHSLNQSAVKQPPLPTGSPRFIVPSNAPPQDFRLRAQYSLLAQSPSNAAHPASAPSQPGTTLFTFPLNMLPHLPFDSYSSPQGHRDAQPNVSPLAVMPLSLTSPVLCDDLLSLDMLEARLDELYGTPSF
jgi:hypothetical protein